MTSAKIEDLTKGEFMEEQLRAYFLDLGYYVVRGAKLKFSGVDVTDIDLWIYHRSTPISRERINVDLKNKAKPVAIERIIVAKGIMNILGNDRCIVATTDKREEVIEFGEKHGVRVLNGNFLNRIKGIKTDRITEEEFNSLLKDEFSKFSTNWFVKYESAKSRLLENLDFVVSNQILQDIQVILEQIYSTPQKKNGLLRLLYLLISHLFVVIDFILKDMAFIETPLKLRNLEDGFRFGAFGPTKIKLRLEHIAKETNLSISDIKKASEIIPADILKEFFGRNEVTKNLFKWAKEFEDLGYLKSLIVPSSLSTELKSIIGFICDCSRIERKHILGI
ncbi:MAG TPA: hypothetical protein VK625_19730 [Flavitalea sp.]|nr:hypothetical protein [Flavitalea sp.]